MANCGRESPGQGGGLGVRCPRGSSSQAPLTVPSPQGRGGTGQRWVRFHSLPGSKRYADDEEEYAELMCRHLAVLAELLSLEGGDRSRELLVVTASRSGPRPAHRDQLRHAHQDWLSAHPAGL